MVPTRIADGRSDETITQGSKREINWVLVGVKVLSYRGLRCEAQKTHRVVGNFSQFPALKFQIVPLRCLLLRKRTLERNGIRAQRLGVALCGLFIP
jgi:hypothetical protein